MPNRASPLPQVEWSKQYLPTLPQSRLQLPIMPGMPAVLSSLATPLGDDLPTFNLTDLDFAYFGNLTNLSAYTALPSVAAVVERLPAMPPLAADIGLYFNVVKFAITNTITTISRYPPPSSGLPSCGFAT